VALSLIFAPLIGAALMPILRKIWSRATSLVAVLIAVYLVVLTLGSACLELVGESELLYQKVVMGGTMVLRIDGLALMALATISLVTLVTLIFSIGFPLDPDRRPGYNALILLAVTGMNGMVMASDLFSLFVFLEILSVASFILIAYQLDGFGIEGAFKYMMLSAVATIFLLTGIAIVFALSGGLTFTDLQGLVTKDGGSPLLQIALMLILGAFALKAGIMPFHAWLPDAYTAAPAPVSVFLGGIVTKVAGVYALFRLSLLVFDFANPSPLLQILLVFGAVSMVLGAFMALGQRDFKRMLAFSSISQIGYILLGVLTGSPLGIIGAGFHFFNHAVFKSLLFLNAGSVEAATGTRNFDELGGLAKQMPVTGVTSIIGLLSTAGIPPLAGFWSKLLIIIALWAAGYQLIALLAVITSLVTLAYLLSLQREVFFGKLRAGLEEITEVKPILYWPAIILAAVVILSGLLFPWVIQKLIMPLGAIQSLLVK
jgi:multicomponent Na+:H+ antiporter subunit D